MDLLLQAAEVLELNDSSIGVGLVTPKPTRGAHFHQYAKSRDENSENSDGSYGENGVETSEDDSSSNHKKRFGGKNSYRSGNRKQENQPNKHLIQPLSSAGTREVHNQLEKNRRRHLRECFNFLQQCVPALENKRVPTQSILQEAIRHIKNLRKKDVEQERVIQMLANEKCKLKKDYDFELNKCSLEQQRLADAFLRVMKAKHGNEVDDGNTSDSTSTASEGPELSDDDKKFFLPAKSFDSGYKMERSRKRKLGSRGSTSSCQVAAPVSQQQIGNNKSSTVSSSSLALKQMLEQRKKNQMTVAAQAQPSDKVHPPAASENKNQAKIVSSITSSYPMISTRLASGLKTSPPESSQSSVAPMVHQSIPSAGHPSTEKNHLAFQTTGLNILANASNAAAVSQQSLVTKSAPNSKRKKSMDSNNSKASQLASSHPVIISPTGPQNARTSSSPVQRKSIKAPKTAAILSAPVTLLQPSLPSTIRMSDVKIDNSQTIVSKILTTPVSTELQGISYLGKNIVGSNVGTITMQSLASLAPPIDSASKLLSTVLPVSLASFSFRSIPFNAVVPSVGSLAPGQISMTSSSQVSNSNVTTSAVSSLLTNQMHHNLGASLILTSTHKTEANPVTSVALSTNNTRIATLLAAPSQHLKNVVKPNLPLTLSAATGSSQASTITLQNNGLKTMTLAPTLLPLSLGTGQLASSNGNMSPGAHLRFFTPFSPGSVMAASLANGQVMPTVVQLGTSGQVALVQNLIPAQHGQHHVISQPIVVMTAPGGFNVTSASGSSTSSVGPSTTNIL